MFGFLKEKLKSWFGKSKSEIETKEKEKAVAKAPKKKEAEKKGKKTEVKPVKVKPVKVEKRKRSKQELDEERKLTKQVFSDIEKEGLEIKSPEEKIEDKIQDLERQEGILPEKEQVEEELASEAESEAEEEKIEEVKKIEQPKKLGFFERLKRVFTYQLSPERFEEIFSELEMLLLESNVALEVVEKLKEELSKELVGKELKKEKIEFEIKGVLKRAIEKILSGPEDTIKEIKEFKKISKEPYTILFFGINGAGKTTSIAKFAHLCQKNKLSVVLAAADTFRAASIEQISIHADRLGVKVIKHEYNSDPSAVAFDAIKYAKSNKIDVVLVDTAGRMHTKENLLQEMEKICRVTKPNLKVFVAEAIAGNDATEQAKAFNELIGIDGSILSKTDVDEKGGTIISISFITKKPILYLGIGQNYEDLELFNKKRFIERLGL